MTSNMIEGKQADSARRRERVVKALDAILRTGGDITVSGLVRAARADRSFRCRHRDLLERVHAAATTPVAEGRRSAVTRASLQADLANALERNTRLAARVRQLEKRLSAQLGKQAWSESGPGPRRTSTNSSDALPCWSRNSPRSREGSKKGPRNSKQPGLPTRS